MIKVEGQYLIVLLLYGIIPLLLYSTLQCLLVVHISYCNLCKTDCNSVNPEYVYSVHIFKFKVVWKNYLIWFISDEKLSSEFQQNLSEYAASVSCYASPRGSAAQAVVYLILFWKNYECLDSEQVDYVAEVVVEKFSMAKILFYCCETSHHCN